MRRPAMTLGLCVLIALASGCLERRMYITTNPPGARVWVNDVDAGTTPLRVAYLYHGVYDVRIAREGYEPVMVGKKAFAPWYESVPFDLVASSMPMRIVNEQEWHWDLIESPPPGEEEREQVVERARSMRDQSAGGQ